MIQHKEKTKKNILKDLRNIFKKSAKNIFKARENIPKKRAKNPYTFIACVITWP